MNNNDDKDSKASASLPHRDASAKFPEGQSPERPTWSPITEAASPVPPPDVDDQPLEPESPVRPTWSPITVDSPGVAPPLSTEVSPPLDIRKYLEGLILYTELLRTQFKHDVHPRSFFVDIGGEKYLDARIVITNKRADNQARALGNPALQLNLKIANSMDELFQHLEKMRRDDEANLLRAIVPMQNIAGGPKHRVFYEAQKEDGKISLVIREPTTEKAAAALINEFIEHNNNYPGAVHNASVRVTNVQKAAAGCPSFAITDAANHAKDPKDGNRIHDEQLSAPRRKIQLIIDSFGVGLNWRAYLHAQSKGQVTEVVDNPRHADAKLKETLYNKKEETFPQRHENHRVTQDVFALQDGSYEARTFSNSIDYRRLRELDYLIDYIKQLIGEHGEGKAGEIFQQELSAVWLSGHSNEEILGVEHFEPYKEVIEQVCELSKGLTTDEDLTVDRSRTKSKGKQQDPLQQLILAQNVFDNISNWNPFPELRSQAVHLVNKTVEEFFEENKSEKQNVVKVAMDILTKAGDVVKKLAGDDLHLQIHEGYELITLLGMNIQLLDQLDVEDHFAHIEKMCETMEASHDAVKKEQGIEVIRGVLVSHSYGGNYDAQYGRVLLSAARCCVNSAHADEAAQSALGEDALTNGKLDKFAMFDDLWKDYKDSNKSEIYKALRSAIELAVNLSRAELTSLLVSNTNAARPAVIPLTKLAQEYSQIQANWLTFDTLKKKRLERTEQEVPGVSQQPTIPFDRVDLDSEYLRSKAEVSSKRNVGERGQSSRKRGRKK